MITKSTVADSENEAKYRSLIAEGLRELREIQKESLQQRAEIERLRASWQRKSKATQEILRRVEATL